METAGHIGTSDWSNRHRHRMVKASVRALVEGWKRPTFVRPAIALRDQRRYGGKRGPPAARGVVGSIRFVVVIWRGGRGIVNSRGGDRMSRRCDRPEIVIGDHPWPHGAGISSSFPGPDFHLRILAFVRKMRRYIDLWWGFNSGLPRRVGGFEERPCFGLAKTPVRGGGRGIGWYPPRSKPTPLPLSLQLGLRGLRILDRLFVLSGPLWVSVGIGMLRQIVQPGEAFPAVTKKRSFFSVGPV